MRALRLGLLPLAFVVCGVLGSGCATTRQAPTYVVSVERGDTLASIAMKYDTDWKKIAALNRLKAGSVLTPGQTLRVQPGPGGYAAGVPTAAEQRSGRKAGFLGFGRARGDAQNADSDNAMFEEAAHGDEEEARQGSSRQAPGRKSKAGLLFKGAQSSIDLVWPLQGEMSSPFGWRGRRAHKGVDIRAPYGTPIAAAGAGRVAFAGRRRGYGRLVIIQHGEIKTYYAHLASIEVAAGAKVSAGELIGEVGTSGNATGPHLHFEIRDPKGEAIDPLRVLERDMLVATH